METMTAVFPSRPLVRLDNIIVYSGPPPAKKQKNHHLSRSRRSTNTTSASPIIQQDESSPSPALEVDDQPTWENHRIVGSVRKHGKVFYKVQWKPTWEPAASLQGSADATIEEFRSSNKYRVTKQGAFTSACNHTSTTTLAMVILMTGSFLHGLDQLSSLSVALLFSTNCHRITYIRPFTTP